MVGIIVKSYAHVNKALPNWDTPHGKVIRSKDHYDYEMKKAGMVSYEQAQQMATGPKLKDYKLSKDAQAIIESARASADSKGNVKLSDKTVAAMIKKGAIGKKIPSYMGTSTEYATGFSLSKEQQAIVDSCK
jgi:hypothetical protein